MKRRIGVDPERVVLLVSAQGGLKGEKTSRLLIASGSPAQGGEQGKRERSGGKNGKSDQHGGRLRVTRDLAELERKKKKRTKTVIAIPFHCLAEYWRAMRGKKKDQFWGRFHGTHSAQRGHAVGDGEKRKKKIFHGATLIPPPNRIRSGRKGG